jgi:hypothetical protein
MTEPAGWWLYAVTENQPGPDVHGIAGVGGGAAEVIPAAGLAAVAEQVPLAEFSQAALAGHLEDLGWLEAAARAHHRVIDAAARHGPVVPARLATVYASAGGVRDALSGQAPAFRAVLQRVRGHREWGLKAYPAPPPGPGTGAPGRPAGPGENDETRGRRSAGMPEPGAGAAYLRRRRAELSAQETGRRAAAADAARVHAGLAALAAGTRLHPPQVAQLSGTSAPMLLNAAYLVCDERSGAFADALSAIAQTARSLRLERTGPWPPYSFAELPPAEVTA